MPTVVVKSESRAGTAVRLIAIHTNEGNHPVGSPDHTAENLATYLDSENLAGRYKSYHRICDDDSTVTYVNDSQAAWAMPNGGNLPALQLCFTGWAAWERADWLSHASMLERGAAVVRQWASAFSIPVRHLSPSQVFAGLSGVIGHVDWTNSAPGKRGNHTDPGGSFPWDVFLKMIGGDDLQRDERDALFDVRMQMTGSVTLGEYPGWPAHPDSTTSPKTLVDYVRALHAAQREQAAKLDLIIAKMGAA